MSTEHFPSLETQEEIDEQVNATCARGVKLFDGDPDSLEPRIADAGSKDLVFHGLSKEGQQALSQTIRKIAKDPEAAKKQFDIMLPHTAEAAS